MASVYKPSGRRFWTIQYTDAEGKTRRRSARTTDKRTALQIAAEIEKEVNQIRHGLASPSSIRRSRAAAQSVASHVADFEASIRSRSRTEQHVHEIIRDVKRVIALGEIRTLIDLTPSRVDRGLDPLIKKGLAVRTVNKARNAMKQFSRWLEADGRIERDELRSMRSPDPRPHSRRRRRALSADEVKKLLESTRKSARMGARLSGVDRAMLYELALNTGLRARELSVMSIVNFDLDARPPTWSIDARDEKGRRGDRLPLPRRFATRFARWLPTRPVGPIFGTVHLWKRTARLLTADLAEAGIVRETPAGVADFHSLRHTFGTNLALAGVPLVEAQRLMRHSTPVLTANYYTHLDVERLADSINALEG